MMSNLPEPKLVSRFTRRNSTIEIWASADRTWLRKTYHARYQVSDEADAYKAFKQLLATIPGIRTAEVYGVDEPNNALDMEFVEGPTLAKELAARGGAIFQKIQEPLLKLLVLAHQKNQHLDSDPTNLMIEKQSGELVLIDPICADLDLSHFSAMVFFWGLVKNFVSQAYRVDRWWSFAKTWRSLRKAYLQQAPCTPHLFHLELSQYIATVLSWNVKESAQESVLKRLVRWTMIIPLWSALYLVFRLLAAIQKH